MQGIMEICPKIVSVALLLTLTDSIITIQNYFDSIPTGKIDVFFLYLKKIQLKPFPLHPPSFLVFLFFSITPI